MERGSITWGVTRAVRVFAFPVLETEFVAGISILGTESTVGIARHLTSVFLTVA